MTSDDIFLTSNAKGFRMLCIKPELTQDIVFQCGGEQVIVRPYIDNRGMMKLAIDAPQKVEVFRRPATAELARKAVPQ